MEIFGTPGSMGDAQIGECACGCNCYCGSCLYPQLSADAQSRTFTSYMVENMHLVELA